MDLEEQRDYPRFPLDAEARIINREGTSSSYGRIQDISKAGVRLLSDRPVLLDTFYTLLFAVPLENGCSGNVFVLMDPVFCNAAEDGSGFLIGFAFRHVGASHEARILSYIAQRQHACPQGRRRTVPHYMRDMSPVPMRRSWQEAYRDD